MDWNESFNGLKRQAAEHLSDRDLRDPDRGRA
jgi:hypothetical protein